MKDAHRLNKSPEKILVVRNDKLGDFMLSWPSFAALRQAFPDARIVALVPNYTKPIAELCPWIDELLIDPTESAGQAGFRDLLKRTKQHHFDLMVTLFSTSRIGLLGLLAGIPQRWAPATKLAQLFYNHRLKQKRSHSAKPEYQYNLDLVEAVKHNYQNHAEYQFAAPYLPLEPAEREQLRQAFEQQHQLSSSDRLIFIHAGHGGSANNLSLEQYAQLAAAIDQPQACFILTAGPGELEATQQLADMFSEKGVNHRIFNSTEGLQSFAKHLALADLFIAGSTGTLHIAGALDRPTVGFYPNRRSSTPLRWRTLNSEGHYLALTPPSDIEQDMSRVDIDAAAVKTKEFLKLLYS